MNGAASKQPEKNDQSPPSRSRFAQFFRKLKRKHKDTPTSEEHSDKTYSKRHSTATTSSSCHLEERGDFGPDGKHAKARGPLHEDTASRTDHESDSGVPKANHQETKSGKEAHQIETNDDNDFLDVEFGFEPHPEIEPNQVISHPQLRRFIGIGFSLLSSCMFGMAATMIRFAENYHPFEVTFWKFQSIMYPSIVILLIEKLYWHMRPCKTLCPLVRCVCQSEKTQFRCCESEYCKCTVAIEKDEDFREKIKTLGYLTLRAVGGTVSQVTHHFAIEHIGAGNATAIGFSHPILVSILAWLFLGEEFGYIIAVAIVLDLVGLVVMAKPVWLFGEQPEPAGLMGTGGKYFDPKSRSVTLGVIFGVSTLVGVTISFLSLRLLRKTNFSTISLFYGTFGSVWILVAMVIVGVVSEVPQGGSDWALAFGIGTSVYLGQVFLTLSLRFEQASICALLRVFDAIFAYVWDFIFHHIVPDTISICGYLILMVGLILITGRKVVEGLPPESKYRHRLRFLLL